MKIHKEGSGSYHFSWYMTTVYPINIRYISMHSPYNHTWPHMVSLLFVADMHINLLYLDAPFFYSYSCFWMVYYTGVHVTTFVHYAALQVLAHADR